jgi:hypothetical protein
VDLTGGKLRNPAGGCLGSDELKVDLGVLCHEGFEADGEVRPLGGHIGGPLELTGGNSTTRMEERTLLISYGSTEACSVRNSKPTGRSGC